MGATRLSHTIRIRTLIVLVLVSAVLMGLWKEAYLRPVRQWQNAILDDNNGPRRWEALSLAAQGRATGVDQTTAVDLLINALSDPSIRVRQTAASSLPRFSPASRIAIPALVKALGDPDYVVRGCAAAALGEIPIPPSDPDRVVVISALTCALNESYVQNRIGAAHALAQQGEGKAALPTLIDGLRPRNGWNRYEAMTGLRLISMPEVKAAIPALKLMVADSATAEGGSDLPLKLGRVYAAELLFRFGEPESALAILHEAENSSDAEVRREGLRVLKRLGR